MFRHLNHNHLVTLTIIIMIFIPQDENDDHHHLPRIIIIIIIIIEMWQRGFGELMILILGRLRVCWHQTPIYCCLMGSTSAFTGKIIIFSDMIKTPNPIYCCLMGSTSAFTGKIIIFSDMIKTQTPIYCCLMGSTSAFTIRIILASDIITSPPAKGSMQNLRFCFHSSEKYNFEEFETQCICTFYGENAFFSLSRRCNLLNNLQKQCNALMNTWQSSYFSNKLMHFTWFSRGFPLFKNSTSVKD